MNCRTSSPGTYSAHGTASLSNSPHGLPARETATSSACSDHATRLRPAADDGDLTDLDLDVEDADDADLPEKLSVQSLGQMWASSMGLSFAVPADVDVVSAVVGWGGYATEQSTDEDGRTRRIWMRVPYRFEREVRVDTSGSTVHWLVGSDGDE